jgi:septum formation protein
VKTILASASPRRQELLSQLIPNFETFTSNVEELHDAEMVSEHMVQKNAFRKVIYAYSKLSYEAMLIISADTIIKTSEGLLLGKPQNHEQAVDFLQFLSGKTHLAISGVAILLKKKPCQFLELFSETSELVFHTLSRSSIENYVTTFKPFDKAGAYGIQELPQGFLKSLKGSMNNVMGLPTETLRSVLSKYMTCT